VAPPCLASVGSEDGSREAEVGSQELACVRMGRKERPVERERVAFISRRAEYSISISIVLLSEVENAQYN
jgi:hypothetical protein